MEHLRRAAHAGSWYTNNARKLEEELDGWLGAAGLTKSPDVRAVIAPHAGYSYSGRCAAYAFGNIDPTNISRVFLLGPSHHYYTPKCALTRATVYCTPIGDLPVDQEVIEELYATGKFEYMDLSVDEAEHSMEMHLPYLAKVFQGHTVKVVPILVGALSFQNEAMYGQLLSKYVDDPTNFFSVSSDFCHWGSRCGRVLPRNRKAPYVLRCLGIKVRCNNSSRENPLNIEIHLLLVRASIKVHSFELLV
ncbi:protein MEMO1 homolog isoform X3 [Panicum virgatum]|uniref:protein MEMO1 homolog isoform X3 n=1 Tax=Panicum virgatum TaxID=38727 RepID=UPI0019D539EF|nr:protein MEMO1 homolog isoform X3 [Panicum virgatum]